LPPEHALLADDVLIVAFDSEQLVAGEPPPALAVHAHAGMQQSQ
jgi:hypothetical protein